MNAVNLLPPELRRGLGTPGRSGGAVYGVLGALGVAVLMVAVVAVLHRTVNDREAEVARVEAEATSAEQRAATLIKYKALGKTAAARVGAVRTVAAGRVDWSESLAQVSEAVGSEVAFSTMTATSAPGTGGSGSNPLRGALQVPAVEIVGCARNHGAVARVMARFRAMQSVKRVSLSSSEKDESAGGSSSSASGDSGDCRAGGRLPSQFSVVVFLEKAAAPAESSTTASTTGSTSSETTR
jgi:Tfp pilus assembly protein PilN